MQLRLTFNTLKHLIACCLLITGFALPLSAWAVDTDGDGVDNSIDAFPDDACVAADTDNDGFPDAWLNATCGKETFSSGAAPAGWTMHGVSYGAYGIRFYCTNCGNNYAFVTHKTGQRLIFTVVGSTTLGTPPLSINFGSKSCKIISSSRSICTVQLTRGTQVLEWSGKPYCPMMMGTTCIGGYVYPEVNNIIYDPLDNCLTVSNADQLDTDGDGVGDACNNDGDNDGVLNANDNCPSNANANQLNTDGDAQGNACDTDDDNDGVADATDKFPLDASEALDTDNDGIGNNADTDDDNDGVADATDKFPLDASEALDTDNDGIGNNADTDDDNDGDLDSDEIAQGTDPLNPVENSGAHTTVSFENGLPAGWIKPATANVGWILDATQASHLTKSLRTAPTGNSQKAQVQMTAFFGGTAFSFDLKVSSESNNDNFRVYVDGAGQVIKSGELAWQTIIVPITAGTHTIKFEYLKNGSLASGSDAVWIDKFSFSNGDVDNDGQANTVDLDDDNDGVPDYLDPEPLNPANSSVWPLNNHYQGGAVNESQTVQ